MALDNILYVNSASVVSFNASGSVPNGVSFFGTSSAAISSSFAVSASWAPAQNTTTYAVSSSWASSSLFTTSASFASQSISSSFSTTSSYFTIFPLVKSGIISASLFTGIPLTVTASFTIPMPNTLYSVSIIGGDARNWTVEFVSASNFTISTNSSQALTDYVRWTAIGIGESV